MAKTGELHGLVVLLYTAGGRGGASRPLRHAERPLRELGIHLHFAAVRTVVHFLMSLAQVRQFRYDFVLYNGLASISHRSHFGYPLWRMTRMLRIPTFIYWHETDWVLGQQARQYPTHTARVRHIALDGSVVHLTVSEACKESIEKHFPGVQPAVVYNCTGVPAPFDRPASPTEPPTVVNLASIQPRKGTDLFVDTAIEVCRRHPSVEFMWLGDGEPFGSWQAQIEQAGLQDRILFPGYVAAGYLMLRRASVLFLASRDDPFPLSVLEAMCLGRSIVSFDVGGAPEALAGLGHVIPPFDTDLAAEAILDCLRLPPDQRIDLALRQRYLDLYTPERFAARLAQVLREHLCHAN
ncbi:MAG: glycosyltransferase family 4 protein [Anaerolineae bacterium]